jgi:heme exporter protein B
VNEYSGPVSASLQRPLAAREAVVSNNGGSGTPPAAAGEAIVSAGAGAGESPLTAARLIVARDLKLAFRKRGQLIQPLIFFAIVTALFPLGVSPELSRLREIAPGALWIGALLSSLLALEFLFRDDAHDGTLEQYALSGRSLTWLLLAKTATHWLLTGLPLALMAPVAALSLGAPMGAVPGIVGSVALGTVALSLIGSIGAALTLGVRRSGALLPLLILPISVPVLIFGARATELAITGESYSAPLYLLGAMAVLGITLAPLASAAAVRISLE